MGRFDYLLELLREIGPTEGDKPLSSTEIAHWSDMTGIRLQTWEFRIIRDLSALYLNKYREFAGTDALAPGGRQEAQEVVERKLDRIFGP